MEEALQQIKEWVVNDYFTPSIKAEVILDTLLTPYITDLIQAGCEEIKEALRFVTKEMSLGTGHKNNRGSKIDYILAGDQFVYLIELKTTNSSINDKQAERYRSCCRPGQTFGKVFGKKLLKIMEDQWMWAGNKRSNQKPKRQLPETYLDLPEEKYTERMTELFELFALKGTFPSNETRARTTLLVNQWGSTYKYLYVMGQLLDYNGKLLWDMPLRTIYLTPDGKCPNGFVSVNLSEAVAKLKRKFPEDEYVSMLKGIIDSIYRGNMPSLTIYRGTHQIGGCCTEISVDGKRILFTGDFRDHGIVGGKRPGLADAGRLCPPKHRPAHHRGHHAQPRMYNTAGPLVR